MVIHYTFCFFLMIIILLQAGKGADIGALFGGASQTVFGGRGPATFLNKMTAVVAAGFFVTSIWLAHLAKVETGKTVIDEATRVEGKGPIPDADKPLMDLQEKDKKAPPSEAKPSEAPKK